MMHAEVMVMWRRFLTAVVTAAALAFLMAEGYTLYHRFDHRPRTVHPVIGTRPALLARLPPRRPDETFTFAVVGDINAGLETFETILTALAAERPDFIVLLGDVVPHPDVRRHRFLIEELEQENAFPIPILLVAGNHDVAPPGCTIAQFEEIYGPADWQFQRGSALFIGLGGWREPSRTAATRQFLARTLEEAGPDVRLRFVFQHVPPALGQEFEMETMAERMAPLDLFARHRVDYVFAGHHHRFVRRIQDGTTYVIAGSGGAALRPDGTSSAYAHFHHALLLRVTATDVTEQILVFPAAHWADRLVEWPEFIALAVWLPWAQRHAAAMGAVNVAALAWLVGMTVRWRRRRRPAGLATHVTRRPQAPAQQETRTP
jgi:predicted phosphodiesterase